MATVTPNFNWPVPTSTDLVKDGATAIEALGDSIDASLVDLKGGTSGQVLAKNSNTDMDFSWVAQDDSNAIQNAIMDAKGDLIGATAADTPARLAVGTNGQVLTADSTAATGIKWATPAVASSGLTLIQTTSTGGSVTAINFGSNAAPVFSSTYDNYKIIFVGTASTGLNPQMRMRADTTNATGANYDHQYLNATGTSALAARTTGATFNELPAVSTTAASFTVDLYSPFLTTATTYYSVGPSGISTISIQSFAGQHTLATSYNGFGILTGSAATINGTFYIYGLAK
jgi:hypothetical protein